MAQKIGFQSGIKAAINRLRKLDPGGTNTQGTGAWDKLERTLTILAADHDAAIADPDPEPPPPPPPPPPPALKLAPQTYNKGSSGQNARFCVQGLPRMNDPAHPWHGRLYDDRASYDDNGRCWGGRSEQNVPGLKPSDQMDGRGPCDPYDGMPPWPAKSYEV